MGLVMRSFDLYLIIVMLMGLGFTISNGYKFYVGGKDGWVLTPSEDYSHWSHRNRFQVNDTLHFKYNKGKDSVLEVSEQEYNTCNTTHPLTSLSDGDSFFLLSRSGSFFFISGNSQNCLKGQKLAVKVMSTAHHSPRHTSPSPSPSPSLAPVQQVLSSPGPSPGPEPSSDSNDHAPAPGPVLAHNSAGLVGPGMVVFMIMITSMF
ncbi:hypothetical protein CARUB_v10007282mg [Capsella rubella]|uniref:Phytocyanin domain-containing protein n=1 Tax=Capsella rubella TaxID=81985 RepID=R0GP98_9BRAS|nr:early nodulin-like protein 2 [Capsella rubella]EOA18704.1 hypothetical protein CARUB_v10007282mg [Capsella rubella]